MAAASVNNMGAATSVQYGRADITAKSGGSGPDIKVVPATLSRNPFQAGV